MASIADSADTPGASIRVCVCEAVEIPLNTHTLMEVGVSAGSAALATEGRKHRANDAKCVLYCIE